MSRVASGKTRIDKCYEKQKNGSYYVYERHSVYDPASGQYKSVKKVLLGKIPEGHPKTEDPIPTRPKRKSVAKHGQELTVEQYPTAMIEILNHILETSGVKAELESALEDEDDKGLRDKIQTCALYLLVNDGESWAGMHNWTRDNLGFLPYVHGPITKDISHDLVKYLGENPAIKNKVFLLRAKKLDDDELLALDSSTYIVETKTGEIRIVQYAMHKDNTIRQLYKAVEVYAINCRKPVAFALIPANIPDCNTVAAVLKQLEFLNLKSLELISDGGYCTDATIGLMLSKHQHFVTHIETNTKWIVPIIDQHREELLYGGEVIGIDPSYTGMRFPVKHTFKYVDEAGEEQTITRRVNVFIYHSTARAAKDEEAMLAKFEQYKEDLIDGAALCDDKKDFDSFCDKYMKVTKDASGKVLEVTRKSANWKKLMRLNGFLVILADKEKDVNKGFEKYRAREKVEEDIKNDKSHAGGDVTYKHSTITIDGQYFIRFESRTLRESFDLELKSIRRNLAVPNGNDEHDTSENLKLERKLRSWLQHTSLVNIIKWFAKLTATSIHHGKKEYLWQPDYIKRDKLFLKKIGLYQGDEK